MANKIGRPLHPEEVVHHKDEDPTNDDPGNLVLYENQNAHYAAEHQHQRDYSAMARKANEIRWAA